MAVAARSRFMVAACAAVWSMHANASPVSAPPSGPLYGIFPVANLKLALRHCQYVASATPFDDTNDDFHFVAVPPLLSPAPAGSVSFQSVNFPTYYLAIANQTSGAVGIIDAPTAADATWVLVTGKAPAPSGANNSYSIQSASTGAWAGSYLTYASTNNAPCQWTPPSGDAMLTDGSGDPTRVTWVVGNAPPAPPNAAVSVAVDASQIVNPSVNRRWMGCHSDYGFAQTPRFFTSNLIYGSSFEAGTMAVPAWTNTQTAGANAGFGIATSSSFSSKPSMGISIPNNAPAGSEAGLVNRGIGGAGFSLVGGQPYTVETFIWSGNTATGFVELRDFTTNASLARTEFQINATGPSWGSTWIRYTFTLTPSASTECVGIPFGSDPTIDCGGNAGPGHVCVRCGGEFVIGLVGAGGVNVGYVNFSPGPWGLVQGPNGPLPVLKSAGDTLTSMGITIMRSGGSVSQSMRWKDWRGPVWNRASQQQIWGDSLLSGWGPFEVIDMCNALGIEPIITLAYDTNDAGDWGDLVEYCWGDATSTTWGRRRALDGHPQVFNITVFELGNEQYNPDWIDQVAEMEARAAAIGAPPLHYMFPQNSGLNAADAARALSLGLPITRIMPDLHVGAGGAVEAAAGLFASPPVPGFNQSAINCETNAGTHDLERALNEAADLIDFFTSPTATTDRIYARTASFCSGASAQFDTWDQGISFFLPNMTWLQPPGYVHVMITNTWAEQTIGATFTAGSPIPFAAQRTADGSQLVLRMVNPSAGVQPFNVTLSNAAMTGSTYTLWTLSAAHTAAENMPSAPQNVAPVQSSQPLPSSTSLSGSLPGYAFGIVVASLA